MPGLAKRTAAPESARPLHRMERGSTPAQRALAGLQHALSDSAVGSGGTLGFAPSGTHGKACSTRLATDLRTSYLLVGNLCGHRAFSRDVLSRSQLEGDRHDGGPRTSRPHVGTDTASKTDAGLAPERQVPGVTLRVKRKRVDVNLEELDRVLDHAREAPLSEPDYDKLKEALHALAGMLPAPRSTEKTSAVLPPADPPQQQNEEKPKGH